MPARDLVDCAVCIFIPVGALETCEVQTDDILSLLKVVWGGWEALFKMPALWTSEMLTL